MAATIFVLVIFAVAVFQIVLAAGAPLGEFAWGGMHKGVLPKRLRIASAISVAIYVLLAVIILDRAGVTAVFPEAIIAPAAWAVFGYLCLGVVMNLVSRSHKERLVMTPVVTALAVTALLVALS